MLKRPCHYYNTTGKCRFGKHCKFLHDIDISQEQVAIKSTKDEAVNREKFDDQGKKVTEIFRDTKSNKDESVSTEEEKGASSNICRFYAENRFCRYGNRCKYQHVLSRKQTPTLTESENVNSYQNEDSTRATQGKVQDEENVDNQQDDKLDQGNSNICRFYSRNRFCRYGNRCKYQHILSRKLTPTVNESDNITHDQNKDSTQGTQDKVPDEENVDNRGGDKQYHLQPAVKTQKSRRVCKFFKQGYCKYSKRCAYYHPSGQKDATDNISEKESSAPKEDGKKVDQQQTVEETGAASDWRQVSRAPKVINVFKREDVNPEKLVELRETEIKQLKRRFPADRLHTVTDTEETAAFIFTFFPTDPDWPFDVKSFDIQVEFGQDYPLKLFKVSVPLDQDLPATVRRYIEVSLQEWVVKKEEECVKKNVVELLFRPFLRWMDRNMETIVTEGLKQLRRELTAKAAGLQFISANELQKEPDHQASFESDDTSEIVEKDSRRPVAYRKTDHVEETYEVPAHGNDGEDKSTDDEEEEDGDEGSADSGEGEGSEEKVHQRPKIDMDTERRGTEMSFRNMQIWYCTTIMMEKLRLTVQCERCKNTTDFATPPNRVNSVSCSKCNNTQLAVFRPVLTHAYSSTFGYLDLDGCMVQDVILQDCHFSLGCVMCSRDILVKSFIPGRVMEVWCRGCHSKMKFSADSVKLTVLTSDGVDSTKFSGKIHSVSVRKNQRVLKDPAIQEGKPLPNNGACKHYKKSFRWLRFPCCGKTYPCDICHDDKEDHEMKFANRMICGFCCKEQPFATERPCNACSSALTKVRTSHWEGGHGCRDKISMSRADDKKYTNLHKTVSNKAKAVQDKNKSKKNTKLRHT